MPPRTDVELNERSLASRFLTGKGIEIGAAHRPVQINPAFCSVTYLDRLSASQIRERFPELAGDEIISPDIICDVAATGLSFIRNDKLDFVIASHLLEHLPNPLGFLLECHRVLRQSGILLLMVPDKNYTFDRDRQITPLPHIIEDLRNDTRTIDEEHLIDFLVCAAKETLPDNPGKRRKMLQRELDRSIHVHVWSCDELVELLEYVVDHEAKSWELCDLYLPKGIKDESIVVLRKTSALSAQALTHFRYSAAALLARESLVGSLLHDTEPDAGGSKAGQQAATEEQTTEDLTPPLHPLPPPVYHQSPPLMVRIYGKARRLLGRVHRRSEPLVTSDETKEHR